MIRLKQFLPVFSIVVLVTVSAGCTGDNVGERESAPAASGSDAPTEASPSDATVAPDPENVPDDNTDYAEDAGNSMAEYEYPDDPMPADSIVGTLCNLNQEYLSALYEHATEESDEGLRMALIGFSDLLGEWESLRAHFPDREEDFDRAGALYDAWDKALLSEENGDSKAADEAMAEAETLLRELPATRDNECE